MIFVLKSLFAQIAAIGSTGVRIDNDRLVVLNFKNMKQYRKCKRKIVNQSAELTASAELYVMKPMNRNAILHFSGRNFAAGVIFSWIAA